MAQYTKNFNSTEQNELTNFCFYLKMNDYQFTIDGITNNVSVTGIDYSTFQTIVSEADTFHTIMTGMKEYFGSEVNNIFRPSEIITPTRITIITGDERKAEWKRRVSVMLDAARRSIIVGGGYTEGEALGWADKARTAERIIAAEASQEEVDGVQAEADARQLGETAEQLAQLQIDNAAAFRAKRNLIDGTGKRLRTQLDSMSDGEMEVVYQALKDLVDGLNEM